MMKVWITRNKNPKEDNMVSIWKDKPRRYIEIEKTGEWKEDKKNRDAKEIEFDGKGRDEDPIYSADYRTFEKYFGYIPEKGTCEEMSLILEYHISPNIPKREKIQKLSR